MKNLMGAVVVGTLGFVAAVGTSSNASAEETRSMNGGGPSVGWYDSNINGGGYLYGSLSPLSNTGFSFYAVSTSGWWFNAVQYFCNSTPSTVRSWTNPNRYNGSNTRNTQCPWGSLGTVVGLLEDI
jgi:hypothetical protein